MSECRKKPIQTQSILTPRRSPFPKITSGRAVSPAPPYKLYSVGVIVLATFFGSLLAGGILMAIDFRRLGNLVAARISLVLAIFSQLLLLGLIWWLPDNVPNRLLNIPQLILMYFVAEGFLGQRLRKHYRERGRASSLWKAFGIGLVCCIINIVAIVIGALIMSENSIEARRPASKVEQDVMQ